MSEHEAMRRLTAKMGKKITANAEDALQTTYKLKIELNNRIEMAGSARSEYDKLHSELGDLQRENTRIAADKIPSDVIMETELQDIRQNTDLIRQSLLEEDRSIGEADLTLMDLRNQLEVKMRKSRERQEAMDMEKDFYRNVLKIDIVKVDSRDESQHDEFLVTFLDLGSSVRLVHDTPSHWHILGAGKPIEGNASHWLAFTRMLCEARNALKDSA